MSYGELPFGMVDAQLFPINADGTLGTAVAVPVGRVIEWKPNEDSEDLTGFGVVVATQQKNTSLDVSFEEGGIPLSVYAAITGNAVVTSGVTPNRTNKLEIARTTARPYLAVLGRALGNDGGDLIVKLHKVKFNLPAGNFNEDQFYITKCDGKGVFDVGDKLYSFKQQETATAIPATGLL